MDRFRQIWTGKWRKWAWPTVCGTLALVWLVTLWVNANLRERVRLLERVATIQEQWCDGVGKVNEVCEKTMVEMAIRLGLDADFMPLVTTALWNRAMGTVSVTKARRKLGAPTVSRGVLEDPRAAMGGPSEDEEEAAIEKAVKGKRWKR